jgi:hypothetical protein
MKVALTTILSLSLAAVAAAQDQQLGARTKAMGGSYTAFEDDPVSIWLNPAGISTQPTSGAIAYQTYVTYPLHENKASNSNTVGFSAGAETTFVDPAFIPSYLGFVFHLGAADSGMALGICYARPYHLNYSFDRVDDPFQKTFVADSNVDQSFNRFRIAFAKDFRLQPQGFLTHVSGGIGVDAGYERWEFKSTTASASDNATALGFGLGALVGIYDNTEDFKVNLGLAYQSAVKWNFNIDPEIFPAFNMPQQFNAGFTFYLLPGTPLRATMDLQWIDWSSTADQPTFPGKEKFQDAINYSIGFEYKVPVPDAGLSLYPRAGYRRFDAPWGNKNNLPMTSNFQLVLDTKASTFNIATFGLGVGWASEAGKSRSVDIGADVGGDSYNFALGFNYEF